MKLISRKNVVHKLMVLILVASVSMLSTKSALAEVIVTHINQQSVTAYTSEPSRLTHSGVSPYIGCCAVHPRRSTDFMIPGNGPGIVNFGTLAVLSEAVPMYPGTTTRSIFTVEDTGDYQFNHSQFFVDVWQGTDYNGGPIDTWCEDEFEIRYLDIKFYHTLP